MDSFEILILKNLYKVNSIDIFYFHEKYLLSPGQMGFFIRKYKRKKIIDFIDNSINLTKNGKDWILKNKNKIFLEERKKYWKNIPEEFKSPFKIKKDKIVVPRFSDKDIFSFLNLKKEHMERE